MPIEPRFVEAAPKRIGVFDSLDGFPALRQTEEVRVRRKQGRKKGETVPLRVGVHDHGQPVGPCAVNPVQQTVEVWVELRGVHTRRGVLKAKQADRWGPLVVCGTTWIRTRDTWIFNPLLYHLSYGTRWRAANVGKLCGSKGGTTGWVEIIVLGCGFLVLSDPPPITGSSISFDEVSKIEDGNTNMGIKLPLEFVSVDDFRHEFS